MNTSLIFTDYEFELNGTQKLENLPDSKTKMFSGIRDWNIKTDISYFPKNHKLKFGANHVFHKFNPTSFSGSYDDLSLEEINNQYAHEYALYTNDEYILSDRILLNFGLRYSGFIQVGPFERYMQDNSGQIGQIATDTIITYNNGETFLSKEEINKNGVLALEFGIEAGFETGDKI